MNGGVVSEAISAPREQDSYIFTANVGEGVQFRVASTNTTSPLAPRISLYGPNGALINASSGRPVAGLSYQASVSGIYTVVIEAGIGSISQTGPYNLYFVQIPGANEGGTLINGGVRSDTIDLGDLDSYTFTANVGESVELSVASTNMTNLLYPVISLYGPNGALIGTSGGTLDHRTTMNGTYTVVVGDGLGPQTGPYSLYFVQIPGANEGGTLINGGVRSDTIDLGDLDSYTFTANAGESVQLRVSSTNAASSLALYLSLYGPNGVLVNAVSVGPAFSLRHKAVESGTYTVVIEALIGSNNQPPGPYNLEFKKLGETTENLLSYVALGDSYSSGEGVFPYFDTTNILSGCHRSTRAYATRIRIPGTTQPIANRPDAKFDFVACSGALTKNITASGEGQNGEPPQLAAVNGVNASRDLITISVGGNDAQFIKLFGYCLVHNHCNDLKPFGPYLDIELGDLFPLLVAVVKARLVDLYSEIRNATPNAPTLVVGYPILVSGKECAALKVPFHEDTKLSESEQMFLRDANQQVNAAVAEAAAQVGLHFVSVAEHFTGHEICGTLDDWINGLVISPNYKSSVHPTSRGQLEYARAINKYLESVRSGWPFGYFSTGLPHNPAPGLSLRAQSSAAAISAPTTPLPEFGDLEVSLASAPAGCAAARALVVPGQLAALKGKGFVASESVTLSLVVGGGQTVSLGTVAADATGNLNTTVTIPTTVPVGAVGTIEALAAGPTGVGRLLFSLVRVAESISVDGDGDGIPDGCDNCPANVNPTQSDLDGDGRGDACDACPEEFTNDEDGDGLCSAVDTCPFDPNNDADKDGLCVPDDNCPTIANPGQEDSDGDGIGDACDTGTVDNCPNDPNKTEPGACGCGVADTDSDGDGTPNCNDQCPNTPGRTTPGPEICNGLDDNCDGVIDNNLSNVGQSCTTGQPGVCSSGTTVCTAGGAVICQARVSPTAERCDGLDNNCNGTTDDGFNVGTSCTVGVGACQRTGAFVCSANGQGTQCNANAGTPSTEVCNGSDDDCDGSVDEGVCAPSCAANVNAQVGVTRGGYRRNSATGRYVQQITLKNTGPTAIPGPVSLVLDTLSSNATLFSLAGNTSCAAPVSPYKNVSVGTDNILNVGETTTIVLEFTNPTNTRITYNTRVLGGPNGR